MILLLLHPQKTFPQTPITAVTATATGRVQADILSILGISRTVKVHQVRTQWEHVHPMLWLHQSTGDKLEVLGQTCLSVTRHNRLALVAP